MADEIIDLSTGKPEKQDEIIDLGTHNQPTQSQPNSFGEMMGQVGTGLKNMAVGLVKPPLRALYSATEYGPEQLMGKKVQPVTLPMVGRLDPMQNMNDAVGTGIQTASLTMPNPTAQGAMFSGGGAMTNPDVTPKDVINNTILGGATGRAMQGVTELPTTMKSIPDVWNNLKNIPAQAERSLGEKIVPQAMTSLRSRIMSMDPEALRAINVSPESISIAEKLKKNYGLSVLPTKQEANSFFKSVIDKAPENIKINPNNLTNVLDDVASKLAPSEERTIRGYLSKPTSTTEAVEGAGAGNIKTSLSKSDYLNLRNYLVNISESGNNPFASALKSALDNDASVKGAIPEINEAKGVFQLSREMRKAHTVLNNPKAQISMQSLLEKAQDPSQVATRNHIQSLLGPDSVDVLAGLDENRQLKTKIGIAKKAGHMAAEATGIGGLVKLLKG